MSLMSRLAGPLLTCVVVFALGAVPVFAAVVVRSADIVDGEVKTPDLNKGAVTNKKLAANAVTGATLNESTLGIVPNADQLDGRDSATFLAGSGRIVSGRATVARGATGAVFSSTLASEVGFNVAYRCPGGSPSVSGAVELRNRSATAMEAWYQDGGDDPVFVQVGANATTQFAANEESHSVKLRLTRPSWDGTHVTVLFSLIGQPTNCKTAGFAILTGP